MSLDCLCDWEKLVCFVTIEACKIWKYRVKINIVQRGNIESAPFKTNTSRSSVWNPSLTEISISSLMAVGANKHCVSMKTHFTTKGPRLIFHSNMLIWVSGRDEGGRPRHTRWWSDTETLSEVEGMNVWSVCSCKACPCKHAELVKNTGCQLIQARSQHTLNMQ